MPGGSSSIRHQGRWWCCDNLSDTWASCDTSDTWAKPSHKLLAATPPRALVTAGVSRNV